MNKFQKQFLEKCINTKIDDELPLFDGIYILPTNRKHDSGYKIMYIIGLDRTHDKYYLLDTYCDVVNFGDFVKNLKELNIDILDNGIIHCWSNYQFIQSNFRVSSCTFDFVDRKNLFWEKEK